MKIDRDDLLDYLKIERWKAQQHLDTNSAERPLSEREIIQSESDVMLLTDIIEDVMNWENIVDGLREFSRRDRSGEME